MGNALCDPNEDGLPPIIDIEVAGAAIGLSRQQSYSAADRKVLPVVRLGARRMGVQTARMNEVIGRPITAADIARGQAIVRARRVAKSGDVPAAVAGAV